MTSSTSLSSKVSRIWSNVTSTFSKKSEVEEDNSQFRHRFLLALQFYCESPSLLLNSDLPADLVEFVSTHQFPIEALAVILELKKGSISSSLSKEERNQQKVTEVSRKLVESWMSSDSCAEALVSLSLGDEIPGIIAETANAHRLLFTLPECFHIPSEDFQSFLLNQVCLSIQAIVHGVKEESYGGKIRSQVLAFLLDRIFIRYYADSEQFFTQTLKPRFNQNNAQVQVVTTKPFVHFVKELAYLNEKDFVARRLVSKILMGFSSYTAFKFAKTVFLVGDGERCAAHSIFFPPEDFLVNSPSWKHALITNIPVKTATKSKQFWGNWSHFIFKGSPSITEVWEACIKNWESLCLSSAVNVHILLPATYALIALAHQIKEAHGEKSAQVLISVVKVFDSVAKCLDSTSEEKRACGMALAQVMGDLHTFKNKETENKLNFTCTNEFFLELVDYYEHGTKIQDLPSSFEKNVKLKKFEVLDSDDEIEDDEENKEEDDYVYVGEEEEEFLASTQEEFRIDERILDYRSKKGRLPMYFSEFVEILVEGGGGKDNEGEVEALKYLCVMKISILLSLGVRIDANMGLVFIKCLLDFEGDCSLEIPVILAIFELSQLHPSEVFETLSKTAFDKDHYTSGHRMIILRRLAEVIQLLSKSKCFSCYNKSLKRHRQELISICPEFFLKYFEPKMKLRYCSSCAPHVVTAEEIEIKHPKKESEQLALTWREIVDKRIKEKTRHFATPKRKTPLVIHDEYSSKLVLIIWASLANRIISHAGFFLNHEERTIRGAPNDAILAQIFRVLGRILLGAGGACPHLGNIAVQVGELARTFAFHSDASVRQSVFALLAILFTICDGANYVIEAFSCGTNIFELFKNFRDRETNMENQGLLDHTIAFIAQAATIDCRLQFPTSSAHSSEESRAYAKLRVLPEVL